MKTAKQLLKQYLNENPGEKATLTNSSTSNLQADNSQRQLAATPEHVIFGEEGFDTILKDFLPDLKILETFGFYNPDTKQFRLMNSLEVTFGQILAFAGDFFGVPEFPICKGSNDAEKKSRFMNAYASLAYNDRAVEEAQALQKAIADEAKHMMKLASEKEGATHAISESMHANEPHQTKIYVDITTEKSGLVGLLGKIRDQMGQLPILYQLNSRYFQLLQTNFDHFVPHAQDVYRIGHELALEVAVLAKEVGEKANLETENKKEKNKLLLQQSELFVLAITLEAFAGHYSTDAFTSAHMRVPRVELHEAAALSSLGDILAHKAHDADYQLWVTSEEHPESWLACGDNYFFETDNYPDALNRVVEMVKKGLTEVINVYKGVTPFSAQSSLEWEKRMWPKPEKAKLGRNPHRLYKVKDGELQELQPDGTRNSLWVNTKGVQELLSQACKHTFNL